MQSISSTAEEKETLAALPQWYAMRVTYRRELKIQDELREKGISSFVPMLTIHKKVGRKIVHKREPAIHNLIFIHASQDYLQEFKRTRPELQYIITREGTTSHKTIVPPRQMQDFIAICESQDEDLVITPQTDFRPGQKVRITDGPFVGMEGTFQQISGRRGKRFIICISGIAAVATASVGTSQIEAI